MTWPLVRLGDVVSRLTNGFVGATRNIYIEEGVPYLLARQVKNNILKFDGKTYVSDEFNIKNKKSMLIKGDVLLVQSGHIGHSAVVPAEHEGHNCHAMIVMTPKEGLKGSFLSLYFHYLLLTGEILEIRTGSTVPHLTCKLVKELLIPYPPIPEQKRIVAILDQVFADIEQARAKTEQNLKNARELFESYLQQVFSQRGEGWVEESMESICNLITCGVAATPKYVDESIGVPFLSAQNVKNGYVTLHKFRYIPKELHTNLTKKNKPGKGDILYSRVGAGFGEAAVVEHTFDFSVYVSLTLIKPQPEKLNNYFLKYYLNSPQIKSLAKASITSSGVPNLNVKTVRLFQVAYPSLKKQDELVSSIKLVEKESVELQVIYEKKLSELNALKKSILQKAFTGELTKTEIKGAVA